MRTFIIAHDGQYIPGEMPGMDVVELKDFRALMKHIGFLYDDEAYEGDDEGIPTDDALVEKFDNANGDGTTFYMVKELINGKVVDVPELFKVVKEIEEK